MAGVEILKLGESLRIVLPVWRECGMGQRADTTWRKDSKNGARERECICMVWSGIAWYYILVALGILQIL